LIHHTYRLKSEIDLSSTSSHFPLVFVKITINVLDVLYRNL